MDLNLIETGLAELTDELTAVRLGECLACYLTRMVEQFGCHEHRFTRRWEAAQSRRMPALVRWAESQGGFCDCEVMFNAFGRGRRSAKHQRLQCEASFVLWAGEDPW